MYTALVILNYNNCADTRECILSILEHNTAPVKFIVVDNGSASADRAGLERFMQDTFGTALRTRHHPSNHASKPLTIATLLLSDVNGGYARGNNLGLQLAYADEQVDKVMVLNNDVVFVEDIIPGLSAKLETTPDCAILSPVLYKPGMQEIDLNCARRSPSVWHLTRKNFMHFVWKAVGHKPLEQYLLADADHARGGLLAIDLPSGSCMLMRKSTIERIGGFDPNTFLYYEENILHKKIAALGLRNYLDLGLACVHKGAATTSAMPSSIALNGHAQRSALYYIKHYTDANAVQVGLFRASSACYMASLRLLKAIKKLSNKHGKA